MIHPDDDISSLERAKERLYKPDAVVPDPRSPLAERGEHMLRHEWERQPPQWSVHSGRGERRVRFAGIFFMVAVVFFLVALASAGYLFYFGGNSVSVDKITVAVQGPTTIAAGDTIPLSLAITNKNPVAIENATIEVDFPSGTRSATDVLQPYPRYTEDLGTLPSGATVVRSVKAVVFGSAGQTLELPISFSYGTSGSSAAFRKKTSYALSISSTPLSVSVDTLSETVSGQPLIFTLTVRSNASVPLANVVLAGSFPFGFTVTSSSLPLTNSTFVIGTMAPGATKTITLVGTLSGQQSEERVFHFILGTAASDADHAITVTYMSQDAAVAISAPFISTVLALNGSTSNTPVIAAGALENVSVSYTNTLATSVTDATVAITLSGNAVDDTSIRTTNGFYRSSDRTIIFSKDTDPSLANLAPGASGIGTFMFSTLAANTLPPFPSVTFSISVSGTRVGQTNVPEAVHSLATKTAKVQTTVALTAAALHSSGSLATTGPIPPQANQPTTYAIVWNVVDKGSAVAGGVVTATLPGYVSYAGKTSGAGSFSYDGSSHTVSWDTGDLAQGGSAQGAFLVSLVPSSSQKGTAPVLAAAASFSGYDRFAGVQVSATADPVTTETPGDPGYVSANGVVQ